MRINKTYKAVGVLGLILIPVLFLMISMSLILDEEIASRFMESETILGSDNESDELSDYLYFVNDHNEFAEGESINIQFKLVSNQTIYDHSYFSNGFTVISSFISGDTLNFQLSRTAEENDQDFTVTVIFYGGKEVSSTVYAYSNEYGTFFNSGSRDDAYEIFTQYAITSGIMTSTEAMQSYMKRLKESGAILEESFMRYGQSAMAMMNMADTSANIQSRSSIADTYIEGTLSWVDDNDQYHPLIGVKVDIYDNDNKIVMNKLGTVYTNDEGKYYFGFVNDSGSIEKGYDLSIKVKAGDDNVHMKKDLFSDYEMESDLDAHANVSTGSTTIINMAVDMSTNLGKAFQITQAAMTARNFAREMMNGNTPSEVKIEFTNDDGCSYSPIFNTIYITQANKSRYGLYAYSSWDVIMHEYGHHVQEDINITDSPGGSHTITGNNADDRDNKDEGIKLAWGESWPTVFGIIAQKYYIDELSNITAVGDDAYSSYNGAQYDLDNSTDAFGEACEGAIISVLWKIFDENFGTEQNTESQTDEGGISFGFHEWWDVTTSGEAKTFSEFINDFYLSYPNYIDEMGELLSRYKMAPSAVFEAETELSSTPPTFSWNAQGGSEKFPNNSFSIIIYNDDFSEYILTPTTTVTNLTLSSTIWNQVLNMSGTTIHVGVVGCQTNSPSTGPYISELKQFTKPIFITSVSEGEITIEDVYGLQSGNVTVPSSIQGLPVTKIAAYAFEDQTNMTALVLPNTIESIGEMAFWNCPNLTYIYACTTKITRVETGAFFTGTNTIVYLPDGLTYIGSMSLAYTHPVRVNVSAVDLSQVTYIGEFSFFQTNLSELIISSALSYIGYGAFSESGLSGNIYLPSTLTTIEGLAFSECNIDTIYTEKNSKPSSWDNDWNYDDQPVVWGCTFSSDKSYVVSVNKTSSSISNSNASGGVTNPGREDYTFAGWYTTSDYTGTKYESLLTAPNGILYAKWEEKACVASGTLITLADGTQKAVEELTGDEELLVWNMFTGEFDSAPILFIDSDPERYYEVVNLYFSDGTTTKVISEHAFWDIDLNKYVFLRNDAAQYIGHWFNKQTVDENGNMINTEVQLTNVVVQQEYTTAWSPVTYGHLCYYVNGMLSMPGATTGLINIFEVDAETMTINQEAYLEDVEEYGLFTYEEFNAICPVPEIIFEAFGGQYLKVSLGKGLITWEELETLIARYAEFWV